MKPVVTVLVDTYNHERFIEEAIVSVIEQDFPRGDVEILIVDDGSTDRTPEIVAKFEPRVRLVRKPNGGQASAFNAGIPQARGAIISFLDGDDWWKKNKLSAVDEGIRGKCIGGCPGPRDRSGRQRHWRRFDSAAGRSLDTSTCVARKALRASAILCVFSAPAA